MVSSCRAPGRRGPRPSTGRPRAPGSRPRKLGGLRPRPCRSAGRDGGARERSAPVGEWRSRVPREPGALPDREVGVLTRGSAGAARRPSTAAGEGRDLGDHDAQRPAVAGDVVEREEDARARRGRGAGGSCAAPARARGRRAGRLLAGLPARLALRRSGVAPLRSTRGSGRAVGAGEIGRIGRIGPIGRINWTARPSRVAKVVRRVSWRQTISARAAASASGRAAPRAASARGML